jgi:hypothetical protein
MTSSKNRRIEGMQAHIMATFVSRLDQRPINDVLTVTLLAACNGHYVFWFQELTCLLGKCSVLIVE